MPTWLIAVLVGIGVLVVLYVPAYLIGGWRAVWVAMAVFSGGRAALQRIGAIHRCPRCGKSEIEYPAYLCTICGFEGTWIEGRFRLRLVERNE